jgi:hypothetical protein
MLGKVPAPSMQLITRSPITSPRLRTLGEVIDLAHAHAFALPRRVSPGLCPIISPTKSEGAGNAGCPLHPRSRVQGCTKEVHTSIQVQTEQSGVPCAMVLRLMPCSPRRRIRFVTVACGLMAIKPGWADLASASLTPATGARTTRFCRTQRLRQRLRPAMCQSAEAVAKVRSAVRPARVDRSRGDPPCHQTCAPGAAASTAFHPASVTIAIRPSCRDGTNRG